MSINPVNGTLSNKSYSPAQAVPTDFRSQFYDSGFAVMRDYASTAEVLSHLDLAKYRSGHFPIYIHVGGVLASGVWTGGTTSEYWFKDGVGDSDLIIKGPIGAAVLTAEFAGLVPNGSDQSAALNSIAANSSVKGIVFSTYGSSSFLFDSTVTLPAGFQLIFLPGNEFSGTGTINGGIYYASYRQKLFATTLTVVPEGLSTSYFSAMWFGAVADYSQDDSPAIQKAMDTVIAATKLPRTLYFPKGTYRLGSPLIAYRWDGTTYQFFSLNLLGENSGHFTGSAYNTRLVTTFNDTFAIGYQRARSSEIRGFSIEGQFTRSFGSTKAYFEEPFSTFVTGGSACRDARYSPYMGVAIDPFFNEPDPGGTNTGVAEVDRYPGLGSWYRGTGTRGGSSAINIYDCRIFGFTVDIGYSINGSTLNAENCTIQNVTAESCKVAFAYGQGQIKNNFIKNTIHWNLVHTVVDAQTYGSPSGLRPCPAYIDGINIAGGVCRIFNVNSNIATSAKNIFAESLYSIGIIQNQAPFTILDSTFHFYDYSSINSYPEFAFWGEKVKFISCDLKVYDDLFNKRVILKGTDIQFENCRFDLPPLPVYGRSSTNKYTLQIRDCLSGGGSPIGISQSSDIPQTYIAGDFKAILNVAFKSPLYTSESYIKYNGKKLDQVVAFTASYITLTVNSSTREAIVNYPAGQAAYLDANDYLIATEGFNALPFIDAFGIDPCVVLGKVKSVDYITGDVTIQHVPRHIPLSTPNVIIAALKLNYSSATIVGDCTNGSAVLSNVMIEDGALPSSLVNSKTSAGYVVSANDGARTITLRAAFSFNATEYLFENLLTERTIVNQLLTPFATEINSFSKPFFKGTEWDMPQQIVIAQDKYPKRYKCIKSGYLSASTLGLAANYQSQWMLISPPIAVYPADVNYMVGDGIGDVVYNTAITANRTVTLPSAAIYKGRIINITNNGGGGGFAIILSPAASTNPGGTIANITDNKWAQVQSDGNLWWLIKSNLF